MRGFFVGDVAGELRGREGLDNELFADRPCSLAAPLLPGCTEAALAQDDLVLLAGSLAVIGGAEVGATVGKMLLVGEEDEQPPAMPRLKMKRAGVRPETHPRPTSRSSRSPATCVSRVGMLSTAPIQ